jgi:hypothetical protein
VDNVNFRLQKRPCTCQINFSVIVGRPKQKITTWAFEFTKGFGLSSEFLSKEFPMTTNCRDDHSEVRRDI